MHKWWYISDKWQTQIYRHKSVCIYLCIVFFKLWNLTFVCETPDFDHHCVKEAIQTKSCRMQVLPFIWREVACSGCSDLRRRSWNRNPTWCHAVMVNPAIRSVKCLHNQPEMWFNPGRVQFMDSMLFDLIVSQHKPPNNPAANHHIAWFGLNKSN